MIADETQLLNQLTKDYLDDKITNILPAEDTEDLSRLDRLTKPNQVIKYLRNQIKNHGNKLPKEVTQLETKIDNSINKTTNKLNKVISDLEKIKNKYNLSFSTSSFKTQAVDSSSFSNVHNLQSSIANTIDSLAESASESQEATDKINQLIPEINSINTEFNNTINSCHSECNQQSTIIIATLLPALEPVQNNNVLVYADSCKSNGSSDDKKAYQVLSAYNFDFDGADLTFVMSLTPEFVEANKNTKFEIYNQMKKDMKNNIKVVAKENGKGNIKVDINSGSIDKDNFTDPVKWYNASNGRPRNPYLDKSAMLNRANQGSKLDKIFYDLVNKNVQFARPIDINNRKYDEILVLSLDLKNKVYKDLASGNSKTKDLEITVSNKHKIKLKLSLDKNSKQGNLFKWKVECLP